MLKMNSTLIDIKYNDNNKNFFIYKLQTFSVNRGLKLTCPERIARVQCTVKSQRRFLIGKTV